MSAKEKSTFSHFFKEDAFSKELISDTSKKKDIVEVDLIRKEIIPEISVSMDVSEDEVNIHWQSLRAFFRNGNNTETLPEDLSPVMLAPLYTKSLVGSEYPLWVADEKYTGAADFCLSLRELISLNLADIDFAKEGNVLNESIERILHIATTQLQDKQPQLFQPAINNILNQLEKELDSSSIEAGNFKKDLQTFITSLPDNGVLLPYSSSTSFQLLEAAMIATLGQPRKTLRRDISHLASQLNDLLRVEEDNNPKKKSDSTKASFGFADSMVNFDEISSMTPHGGSVSMGKERVKRITASVKVLEDAESILSQQGYVFVDELLHKNESIDWQSLFNQVRVEAYKEGKGCDTISKEFEQKLEKWTALFVAKRIAELEITNTYQADIHNDYFEHFSWQNFSAVELNSCPHFILIADDIHLFDTEFTKLSTLFSNNIPVKIIAVSQDHYGGAKDAAGLHTQTELAALMLSHKNIFVAQSTAITPISLFNQLKEGLTAFAPAFYNFLNVDEETFKNPYIWTSTTVESRDFPGFTFNGKLGTPWGSRFNIDNNPQPERLWPIHELSVINAEGEKVLMDFPFTFADQASRNPDYHHHFMLVNSAYWNDNLISLDEYLHNSSEDNIGNIPFVWMIDGKYKLHKVAVSWQLVLATQERLDFWRFLQENSGINNYHANKAVEEAKSVMQEQHNSDISLLREEHTAEIQKIKEEEAGKVMENLTSVLLNLDTANLIPTDSISVSSIAASDTATQTKEVAPEEEAAPEETQEESILSNDPYIDTALCTSCNECTNLNGQMFKYNGDKMAYIADAKAGTFSELVEAAEKCPVKIIHPGAPLNPEEADLESLVARAAKFN